MHYKWMVDTVTMPMGRWQMKYLVLAREDLTNQIEGRALRNKETTVVCKFLLKDIICRYRCVGKIIADPGELDASQGVRFKDGNQVIPHYNIQFGSKRESEMRTWSDREGFS
jgi:hypothetical protein